MAEKEKRCWRGSLRASPDGKIRGTAAVYGTRSEHLGFGYEEIARGAFDNTLTADVRALWQHSPEMVLGRTRSGTLRLWTDSRGLHYEIDPPATTYARDAVASIERGDVSESSFAFRTIEDDWRTEDGEQIRTLRKVELLDVSPVTYAAYKATSVEAAQRSLQEWQEYAGQRNEFYLRRQAKVEREQRELTRRLERGF